MEAVTLSFRSSQPGETITVSRRVTTSGRPLSRATVQRGSNSVVKKIEDRFAHRSVTYRDTYEQADSVQAYRVQALACVIRKQQAKAWTLYARTLDARTHVGDPAVQQSQFLAPNQLHSDKLFVADSQIVAQAIQTSFDRELLERRTYLAVV